MATFIHDTFTIGAGEVAGESLASHVGELGAHWTGQVSGTGDAVVGSGGTARLGGSTSTYWYAQYVASGVPALADYTVQADLSLPVLFNDAAYAWGVLGRVGGITTYYQFAYDTRQSGYVLLKNVGGTQTTLGTHAASFAAGTQHTLQLVMTGEQISGVLDGTTVIGPITDASITAAGQAGLLLFTNSGGTFTPGESNGPQLDNFYGIDTAPDITVSVSPSSATLAPSSTQQFTATVTGSANQAVTWSVQEGASGGTITSGGLYTAPGTLGTFHVVATAAANGTSTGVATVVIYAPAPPGTPAITLATAGGLDTITLPAASTLGTSAIAGYRLYAGTASGFETDGGVFITPTSFPASFPAQPTAAPGAAKYYYVRAIDTADILSAPSNECWSRTTGLVASGQLQARVFIAPYGASASGLAATLGYTVYDYLGALLVPHTTGQTAEIAAGTGTGTGIYAALISLDTAYAGVVVWDAPAGSGPYIEAFDPGALGQVSGYTSAANPATLLLQNPANKLVTNASGQVDLDWSQAVPATAAGLTLGRAALAAIAEGVGVWKYNKGAGTLNEYAEDGTTLLRSFALTLDSSGTITERA